MTNKIIPSQPTPLVQAGAPMGNAIRTWASSTTDPTSARRDDLIHDKARAVLSFFAWTGKAANEITPLDVTAWQAELEGRGLSHSTVYGMISRVSSFYTWALASPEVADRIHFNPVTLARPKSPKAYQTDSTKALDDNELRALVGVVRSKADTGDLVGIRDYAMLILYLTTGLRREEVASLTWGDIKENQGGLILTVRVKGGDLVNREIREPAVKDALIAYLVASGRLETMEPDSPLWTRHDQAGKPGDQLTSHAFAKNLKRYARLAGLGDIHLHQTRHTYARIVAEESGSLNETSDALGHKNLTTTRVYVQRVGVKKDRFSGIVGQRLGIKDNKKDAGL